MSELIRRLSSGSGLRLCKGVLWVLPFGYAVFLLWQEWHFRQNPGASLPVVAPALETVPAEVPPDTSAVATVFGLNTQTALRPSTEALTLQACFVVGTGLSKALLTNAQGPRLYRVGERLPGGSVLRRVEVNQVVLWNKGREERLVLQPPAARFLRRLESPASAPASPFARHLRPISGPSK
ncbi:type II secretion system protein N [Pseudomonas frederiksbergensis]|uniref:type II secretion system protein N n=1 Tax=Pseudomonas frederiksbergensis TaxID=104087 RepID=UPI000F47ECDA|nr:type II secretion system protein N [Pseudomonas frederiksbergensis]RON58972.1 hypothetical protein BK667_01215 [Pseudomonas frederiksbergensis]